MPILILKKLLALGGNAPTNRFQDNKFLIPVTEYLTPH